MFRVPHEVGPGCGSRLAWGRHALAGTTLRNARTRGPRGHGRGLERGRPGAWQNGGRQSPAIRTDGTRRVPHPLPTRGAHCRQFVAPGSSHAVRHRRGAGGDEPTPFLVMEFVPGQTLAQGLRGGPMPWSRAVDIVRDIADTLAYSHEHGLVHRDINPQTSCLPRADPSRCSTSVSRKRSPRRPHGSRDRDDGRHSCIPVSGTDRRRAGRRSRRHLLVGLPAVRAPRRPPPHSSATHPSS